MTDPNGIRVDNAGFHAALEAFMMSDPHPKGWITESPAARIDRALYAYEWAKREYPVSERPDGGWSQQLPDPDKVKEAVKAKEATE